MIALTANIDVIQNINRIVKWEVLSVDDRDQDLPPQLIVKIRLYGAGTVPFLSPILLHVRDNAPSRVVRLNLAPTTMEDQFVVQSLTLPGTPYTVLADLWNGNTASGNKTGRRRAVESSLVAAEVLPPEFAGA
jgi:hypothetical protein